ncbi:MAG: SulP family inorganic anion transporter [Luteolibacter sp.]|uniref:SulP family inorganic anion transporter n=1 Tax=Luteolibacter sp. TaxID=1962973 RepID=UPI003262E241
MSGPQTKTRSLVPALGWLRTYQPAWLRGDIVAGITLAAYLMPAGIGDASLAGLPPAAGLYACLFSGLVFWLFTSSRQTTVTVTSAISLLVGSTLGPMAAGDPARHAALAATTAVMVAALALLARLFRAGVIINFISESVLIGFKCGVALYLASSQLPKLCGLSGSHGDFWERMGHFIRHAGDTNPASIAVGGGALGLLLLGKKFLPNKPTALFVVIGGLWAGAQFDLAAHGVKLLGQVPQGLPAFGFQHMQRSDVNELLPLAMACFLLGAVETAAIGRMFARKHNYRLDSDQEFVALAAANLMAGLGQGFPTSGGMSQSLVNESGGARTPLSGFIAALLILLVTLFLSGMLRFLPQPVLAAIVLVAVTGLFKLSALKQIWSFSRAEFSVAAMALLGVLGSGLLMGVLIGAILSLLLLLHRSMYPHSTELGRVPGTDYFADVIRHQNNQRVPDAFIFRNDGAVLYFNAEYVRDRFFELLDARGPGVRIAVFYLGTVPGLDLAGAELLTEIRETLIERGIDFRLAEAHSGVRETLRRAGFEKFYGPIEPDQTVETVLKKYFPIQPDPSPL